MPSVAVVAFHSMQFTLDSSHTEHTQRSWHVDSICLQERYSDYVIKF